ncbi:sulfotransferase [Allonocardiopsis opalescens]|uniref:sulfotransferase n=1 Tax=Allonocardiopsis opalescens TaxID=1144618 RepID=UPI001FE5916C|nr:sulfotransferase [Allonocardiopsis opalescens]
MWTAHFGVRAGLSPDERTAEVRAALPPNRLVHRTGEGWERLCATCGAAVPAEGFPPPQRHRGDAAACRSGCGSVRSPRSRAATRRDHARPRPGGAVSARSGDRGGRTEKGPVTGAEPFR